MRREFEEFLDDVFIDESWADRYFDSDDDEDYVEILDEEDDLEIVDEGASCEGGDLWSVEQAEHDAVIKAKYNYSRYGRVKISVTNAQRNVAKMLCNGASGQLIEYPEPIPRCRFFYVTRDYLRLISSERVMRNFYIILRECFKAGYCIDVKDEVIYINALVEDLVSEYEESLDINKLEEWMDRIISVYPFCAARAAKAIVEASFEAYTTRDPLFYTLVNIVRDRSLITVPFIEKMLRVNEARAKGLMAELVRCNLVMLSMSGKSYRVMFWYKPTIKPQLTPEMLSDLIDRYPQYSWSAGQMFGRRFDMSGEEIEIIDDIYRSNSFLDIPQCANAVVELFIKSLRGVCASYGDGLYQFRKELEFVGEVIIRKVLRYRRGSANFVAAKETIEGAILSTMLKMCENRVREICSITRMRSYPEWVDNREVTKDSHGIDVIELIANAIDENCKFSDDQLTLASRIELNQILKSRWKVQFERIKAELVSGGDVAKFEAAVMRLCEENVKNTSLHSILLSSYKVAFDYDKVKGLSIYLCYVRATINCDVEVKPLMKKHIKLAFKDAEKELQFNEMVSRVMSGGEVNCELERVAELFQVKRRKIEIDTSAVKRAKKHHSESVEILERYLADEEPEEVVAEPVAAAASSVAFVEGVTLKEQEAAILGEMVAKGYSVGQGELNAFAKSLGLFAAQVVERINDACYEVLDDLLIEEEGDKYIMNEEYYKEIIEQ